MKAIDLAMGWIAGLLFLVLSAWVGEVHAASTYHVYWQVGAGSGGPCGGSWPAYSGQSAGDWANAVKVSLEAQHSCDNPNVPGFIRTVTVSNTQEFYLSNGNAVVQTHYEIRDSNGSLRFQGDVSAPWVCPYGGTGNDSNPATQDFMCKSVPECPSGQVRSPTGECVDPCPAAGTPSGPNSTITIPVGWRSADGVDLSTCGSPGQPKCPCTGCQLTDPYTRMYSVPGGEYQGCQIQLGPSTQCQVAVTKPTVVTCNFTYTYTGQFMVTGDTDPAALFQSTASCPDGMSVQTFNGSSGCYSNNFLPAPPQTSSNDGQGTVVNNGDGTSTRTQTQTNADGSTTTTVTTYSGANGGGSVTSVTTSTAGGGAAGGVVGGKGSTDMAQFCRDNPTAGACGGGGTGTGDEGSMPSGEGAYDGAKGELDTASQQRVDALADVVSSSGKDTSWGFIFSLPSPQCSTIAMWENFTVDPCPAVEVVREVLAWIWYLMTAWVCVGMVGRTMRGQ